MALPSFLVPPTKLRASLISSHAFALCRASLEAPAKEGAGALLLWYSVSIHYVWFLTQGNHGTHPQSSQAWR